MNHERTEVRAITLAVEGLVAGVGGVAARISQHLREEYRTRPSPLHASRRWMVTPRISTGFAVFGARGAGKSTVLGAALAQLSGAASAAGDAWHAVPTPLDLSLAPHGFPLGLYVVDALYASLPPSRGNDALHQQAVAAFDRVRTAYLRRSPGYHDMLRNHAMSPADFRLRGAEEVREAGALPESVATWLEVECAARGWVGLVVALDDVDLVRDEGAEWILWPFLDELHQARLIVIFAADRDRLLALGTRDRTRHIDPQTAVEVLRKVCPVGQQASIGALGLADARAMLRQRLDRARLGPNVNWPEPDPDWDDLLPRNARKLEELSGVAPERDVHVFLSHLAHVHGHGTFGGRVGLRRPASWVAAFRWTGDHDWVPAEDAGLGLATLPRPAEWVARLLDAAAPELGVDTLALTVPALRAALDAASVEVPYSRRDAQDWLIRLADDLPKGAVRVAAELAWVRWTIVDEDHWLATIGLRPYAEAVTRRRRIVDEVLVGELSQEIIDAELHPPSESALPARVAVLHRVAAAARLLPFELLRSPARYRDPSQAVRLVVGLVMSAVQRAANLPSTDGDAWRDRSYTWEDHETRDRLTALIPTVDDPAGGPRARALESLLSRE